MTKRHEIVTWEGEDLLGDSPATLPLIKAAIETDIIN